MLYARSANAADVLPLRLLLGLAQQIVERALVASPAGTVPRSAPHLYTFSLLKGSQALLRGKIWLAFLLHAAPPITKEADDSVEAINR